jgi:DNA polymerase-4
VPSRPEKSISAEETFDSDLTETNAMDRQLMRLTERTASRLRSKELVAGTVQVKIRQADFTTFTRQRALRPPGNGTDQIFEMVRILLHQWLSEHPGARIRLLGVGGSDLSAAEQRDLFADDDMPVSSPLDETVDKIRDRFGKSSVNRARTLDSG